jgi:PBP1b-binding outer membrane lipoprotein LpoB
VKWMPLLIATLLLSGCTGNQAAKSETNSAKPATAKTAPETEEEIPADPYAAMEAERNAVKESIAGKVTEVPNGQENSKQKVYSGVVVVSGKGSPEQTIILDTNRGSFVLTGDKSPELLANEGKFITVLGTPTKGNAVPANLKDLEQIKVEGIIKPVK